MPNKLKLLGLLLFVALSACKTMPLVNIPLVWKPTAEVRPTPGALDAILNANVQFDTFKDVRKQPELIAENREETTAKPVTTRDNVADFVTKHVRGVFDQLGLKTVDTNGDAIISGEVRQFFVDETTTYKGHVVLLVNVRNRAGRTVWSGSAPGTASRFGHSYSAENYYEVFSDSLVNAVSTLLQNPEFQNALGKTK
jgi:hypothetical protein